MLFALCFLLFFSAAVAVAVAVVSVPQHRTGCCAPVVPWRYLTLTLLLVVLAGAFFFPGPVRAASHQPPTKVPEPDIPVHPVDRVRARQGQGEEEGARARVVRRLLLLERLPLQPSAGDNKPAVCPPTSKRRTGSNHTGSCFSALLMDAAKPFDRARHLQRAAAGDCHFL